MDRWAASPLATPAHFATSPLATTALPGTSRLTPSRSGPPVLARAVLLTGLLLAFASSREATSAAAGTLGDALLYSPQQAPSLPVQPAPGSALQEEPHKHVFVRKSRREWVPPVVKQVKVGTDKDGKPIYKTQVVKAGYYRTVFYNECSCGARK